MATKVILPDFNTATNEQLAKNLENMTREKKQYEERIAHDTKLVERNMLRLELMTQMSAISDNENEAINPTYKFQQNKEWVRLHSELLKINSEAERENVRMELETLTRGLEGFKTEVSRFDEAIPLIKAELEKRGE